MTTVQRRDQSDPAPTQENIMLDTVRLYFEATVAVAIMAMFAIIFWICLSRIGQRAPAGLPCRCRGVRAHRDRTDGAPVAHDQNTDSSPEPPT
jgi:hypothetical protein